MDAYQQQPHRYMRPPPPQPPQPPPTMDPHHQYHHQYAQPPRAPTPQPSYYPNQFQYQHHQSHSSPSPPPPPPPPAPSQWGPPPPTVPYPGHPHGAAAGNHFPPHPPRPQLPPPQIPHSYPQVNQEWSNPNWSYHHGWDYSAHNNVEDWGAKAREWANARAALQEQQQPQSQFTSVGRPEDQNHFHDQYQQAVDTHYQDGQQQSLPTLNYQQFPAPAASAHGPPMMYPQESLSGNSAPSYNIVDGHQNYQVKDGTSAMDSNAGFLHQESLPTISSIHQQEVPSSYSSISEKEDLSVSSAQGSQQLQASVPAAGRSGTIEPSFMYGSQAVDPAADLSDRPLDFAPRFNEQDPHIHSGFTAHHESVGVGRGIDPVTAVPSINAWTPPVAPPVVYPSIPPVLPLGAQHDPAMGLPSLSGHSAPPFGRFAGPNFQPTIPTASASFDLGTGAPLHPSAAFPGDTYGSVSERPKKAPVPNWLKEEIIKNKAAIAKSSLEHPKEETQFIEDESVDKSFGKGDQADSKSVDSSRSTEEEDDDEDYVEAARTAAVNQEIKRVLTEVLLKVTDELFDEIATKVLSEDDLTVEVNHNNLSSRPSPSAVPAAKASARVVVPGKGKESDVGLSEKSNSSSPGDVLGLANYASDDDDDNGDETQSLIPESRNNSILQPSSIKRLSENMLDAAENGNSHVEPNEHFRSEKNLGNDLIQPKENKNAAVAGLGENGVDKVHEHPYSSRMVSRNEINANSEKPWDGSNGSRVNDALGEKAMATFELPEKDMSKKSRKDDSQGRESGLKSEKDDHHENSKSSGKDSGREVEIGRVREDEKGDENRRRQDERHLRKEKADDRNGLKEHGLKTGNKAKESESQRRSNHLDTKDEKKHAERSHRGTKEEVDRKREQTKDDDRARHKVGSDSSRHKRRRSSSPSSRGRSSKDNSGSHANDSSDEVSDDSKRKLHTRKHNSSPSPVRSRRRQVSRSPHSKHSQRRHSPYSSLDTTSTRGRRSRSRSPARRQR
ncbi:hypothetical protein SLA2020_402170 [Shorea laevis]